jgi:mRNA-degrading endonuclease HigB of HigAB toxin-antitoxin module
LTSDYIRSFKYICMRIKQKDILIRLKHKNKGNIKLNKAIDQLMITIENRDWKTKEEIKMDRPDADHVHSDGFYFFNINIHRVMILIALDIDTCATVIWAGSHDSYERIFKNSKDTIKKYLSSNDWI